MKNKKQSAKTKPSRVKASKPRPDPISRGKGRRLLKTVVGAAIGGAVAGPIGVAAGAIVGASVRRGPSRRKPRPRPKAKSKSKTKPPGQGGAGRRRFTNIYPNIP